MSQSLYLGDTAYINFNGNELETLKLNGDTIWEIPPILHLTVQRANNSADTTIDGVTYPANSMEVIAISITSGSGGAIATYDGIAKEIPPNSTINCFWGLKDVDDGTAERGDLIITGDFTHVQSVPYSTYYFSCITGVVKWTAGSQLVSTDNMFRAQTDLGGEIIVAEGIKELGESSFASASFTNQTLSVILPSTLERISKRCFVSTMFKLINGVRHLPTIPAKVSKIDSDALAIGFASSEKFEIRFLQPKDIVVELPTAGDGTGIAYDKSSRNFTIYTDNDSIKNYNWAGDNVVATIYHLDGSLWE